VLNELPNEDDFTHYYNATCRLSAEKVRCDVCPARGGKHKLGCPNNPVRNAEDLTYDNFGE
jgi:hypothetical protein